MGSSKEVVILSGVMISNSNFALFKPSKNHQKTLANSISISVNAVHWVQLIENLLKELLVKSKRNLVKKTCYGDLKLNATKPLTPFSDFF